MPIQLTGWDGKPVWVNIAMIVSVSPGATEGESSIRLADGSSQTVKESPDEVIAAWKNKLLRRSMEQK